MENGKVKGFGEKELPNILKQNKSKSPCEVISIINQKVIDYTQGKNLGDDYTILIAEKK